MVVGNEIQRVDAVSGVVTTVSGGGYILNSPSTIPAPATSVFLDSYLTIAVDRAGNIYIGSSEDRAIYKVSAASGEIMTYAKLSNALSPYGNLTAIAVDSSGNLYFSDGYKAIFTISAADQTVRIIAGTVAAGYAGYWGDGGPALGAGISFAVGLALDGSGNLYISDTGNSRIRFIPKRSYPGTISGILPIPASIVNAAAGGQAVAGTVAAGSYVSIYGSGLAGEGLTSASTLPLPTTINGTQVLLGGLPMPLLYASSTQVNALVPEGLVANTQYSLIVTNGGLGSTAVPVTVVSFQPGIYTVDGSGSGNGIIANAISGRLLSPATAAQAGDVVSVYCTGLGPVRGANGGSAPTDGSAAPSNTLYTTTAAVTS